MWDFFKSKGNILLKIALLVFAVMLYMSVAKGISYLMLVFAILLLIVVPFFKFFDRTSAYLLLFSLTYGFAVAMSGNMTRLPIYLLCPCMFYFFGRYIVTKMDQRALFAFIVLTIFLLGMQTYLATVIDIREVGFFNPYRAMNRSGLGDVDLAATLFGLNVSLGFVGLVAFLVKSEENKILRFLLLASFILSLVTVTHLVNRTGLFVFVLCSLAMLFYISPKQGGRILFYILIIGIAILVFVPSSRSFITDIGATYQTREDVELGGGVMTLGNRLWRWVDAIGRVFTSPLGWEGKAEYNYVHNLWLDVAMIGGIFPFLFIVLATIRGIKHVAQLRHTKNDIIIVLLIGLTVASFASAFMEPVMIGCDLYFYLMCMFWGLAYQYRLNLKYGISTSSGNIKQ